ncbi:hypothetical protein ACCO45_004900 [Purpureocillium lilacinum]|uniref:Uncharacterized protein n=1 Tax=Purpureocillium lilacinum TaxID=33203 RepID=A0ACC4DWZ1_PURLI
MRAETRDASRRVATGGSAATSRGSRTGQQTRRKTSTPCGGGACCRNRWAVARGIGGGGDAVQYLPNRLAGFDAIQTPDRQITFKGSPVRHRTAPHRSGLRGHGPYCSRRRGRGRGRSRGRTDGAPGRHFRHPRGRGPRLLGLPSPPPPQQEQSLTARHVLEELSVKHRLNKLSALTAIHTSKPTNALASEATTHSPEVKPQSKPAWRVASRNRRPQIESETFEPLDAVIEEPSSLQEIEAPETPPSEHAQELSHEPIVKDIPPQKVHPLEALDSDPDIREQVEKHLAGQFECLVTYPYPAAEGLAENRGPTHDSAVVRVPSGSTVYGCTFLRRIFHPCSDEHATSGHGFTDGYRLLATPLKADAYFVLGEMDGSEQGVMVSVTEPPPYPGGPLKVPEVVTTVKQALSPSPSIISDQSGSIGDRSSRAGSFSLPRIEDSLEELDKLEEELEAVNEAALSRPVPVPQDVSEPAKASPKTPSTRGTPTAQERPKVPAQSATVRVKRTVNARPSLRRVASLTLREKKPDGPDPAAEQKAAGPLTTRVKPGITRPGAPTVKTPVKSTKPPTVPKFELPGEAVARRLKEQRDAREAKQAEAQKAPPAAPTRTRINRPLAKPTFELPGEAISRRKREEREAKLKAEAEEERKKREFKARPVRHSIGPATLPRATLASLARQNKTSQDDAEEKRAEAGKLKRMSMGMVRPGTATSTSSQSPQPRGRNSTAAMPENSSRTTSASTGRSKRSTLSAEELEQQRLRGKEILERDSILAKDKERDRREREVKAKTAREEAAERSRIASREWAEKKRRREAATKAKEA